MPKWILASVGICIIVIALVMANEFASGAGGSLEISEFKITVNPRPHHEMSPPAPTGSQTSVASTNKCPGQKTEPREQIERWTADSGWRKGGSSPTQFCGGQKLEREKKYPTRKVTLLSANEKHKTERTPFKHDYYRYQCIFEDRWMPTSKTNPSTKC